MEALQCFLEDEGFQLPTTPAILALKTGKELYRWATTGDNAQLHVFTTKLVAMLEKCIDIRSAQACQQARREQMWSKYHEVRNSESFQSMWHEFLGTAIQSQSIPLFWQYISDKVFRTLVKKAFKPKQSDDVSAEEITHEEANALRYTAGYVCRSLKKKINTANHPLKGELI